MYYINFLSLFRFFVFSLICSLVHTLANAFCRSHDHGLAIVPTAKLQNRLIANVLYYVVRNRLIVNESINKIIDEVDGLTMHTDEAPARTTSLYHRNDNSFVSQSISSSAYSPSPFHAKASIVGSCGSLFHLHRLVCVFFLLVFAAGQNIQFCGAFHSLRVCLFTRPSVSLYCHRKGSTHLVCLLKEKKTKPFFHSSSFCKRECVRNHSANETNRSKCV